MMLNRKNKLSTLIAVLTIAAMLVSFVMTTGCAKEKPIKVPDGLSREEAALYVALATVCPQGDNNTKKEYLTFRFEGWSFDEVPEVINEYITDYCRSGNAQLVQADDAMLELLGLLVVNTDPESYYTVGDRVYAEGKGSILTFTLGSDQSTDSGGVCVSYKKFISDSDTSGFDVELKRVGDTWKYEKTSGAWNQYQFFTPEPTDESGPQK
ncbi:MAG: hypothetical protein IKZ82_11115 [Clostridia bacterium]|nr:hypothetical protein [Clostridia bacterium]